MAGRVSQGGHHKKPPKTIRWKLQECVGQSSCWNIKKRHQHKTNEDGYGWGRGGVRSGRSCHRKNFNLTLKIDQNSLQWTRTNFGGFEMWPNIENVSQCFLVLWPSHWTGLIHVPGESVILELRLRNFMFAFPTCILFLLIIYLNFI